MIDVGAPNSGTTGRSCGGVGAGGARNNDHGSSGGDGTDGQQKLAVLPRNDTTVAVAGIGQLPFVTAPAGGGGHAGTFGDGGSGGTPNINGGTPGSGDPGLIGKNGNNAAPGGNGAVLILW
ncbi:hypothetical protein [Streptomyces sp. G45]|uniref:hypothetical protein n=1 Tax=Streptomyces sp. G45 TaxID=3406627 RepID=UPI003C191584